MDSRICTEPDQYVNDRFEGHTHWIIELSNGQTVYQDEDRPDHDPSAWVRLKNHCQENNIHIVKMYLRFRSHKEFLPDNAQGYFFVKVARGNWGSTKTLHKYIVGHIDDDGILHTTKYRIPELLPENHERRKWKPEDLSVIVKKG
jgi:hypothetical protein